MVYQLTYELRSPDWDYSSLYSFLEKDAGDSAIHVLRDSWWIYISKPVSICELRDRIRAFMGEKDIFYISELLKESVDGWMPSSHWKWYSEHPE